VNSAHPGWVKTDMGGAGAMMEIVDGAKTSVALALAGEDSPNGRLSTPRPTAALVTPARPLVRLLRLEQGKGRRPLPPYRRSPHGRGSCFGAESPHYDARMPIRFATRVRISTPGSRCSRV